MQQSIIIEKFKGIDYDVIIKTTNSRLSKGILSKKDMFDDVESDQFILVDRVTPKKIFLQRLIDEDESESIIISNDQKSIDLFFGRNTEGNYMMDYLGELQED